MNVTPNALAQALNNIKIVSSGSSDSLKKPAKMATNTQPSVPDTNPDLIMISNFAQLINPTPFSKFSSKVSAHLPETHSESPFTEKGIIRANSFIEAQKPSQPTEEASSKSCTVSRQSPAGTPRNGGILKQGNRSRFSKEGKAQRAASRSSSSSRIVIREKAH